jgi:hypothetical protein
MKKIFGLLLIGCLLLTGCGKKEAEKEEDIEKTSIVLDCYNKDEVNNNEYSATIVMNKKNFKITSGEIKFKLDMNNGYSQEVLEIALENLKGSFCGTTEKEGLLQSRECDVKLENGIYVGEATIDPEKLAQKVANKSNEDLEESDIAKLETHYRSLFGNTTKCETKRE